MKKKRMISMICAILMSVSLFSQTVFAEEVIETDAYASETVFMDESLEETVTDQTEMETQAESENLTETEASDETDKNSGTETEVTDETDKNSETETGTVDETDKDSGTETEATDETEKNSGTEMGTADETEKDSEVETGTITETEETLGKEIPEEGETQKVIQRKLDAVTNLKAVSAGKKWVKLSWNQVEGADSYIIYRQVGNGKSSYLYITKNLTYVDMNASGNDYNFYWVFPCYNDASGKQVVGPCPRYVYAKGLLNQASNIKAQASGKNRVKLTWNSVQGADGYLIYRQVGKSGYAYRGMTSNLTYTDTTASDVDYNFYWVYPYYNEGNKMVPTTGCKYVYAKGILPAVKNLKSQSVGKSIKLTWDAVSGTEGYIIYRQEGKGKFQYVYMTQNLSYVDSKCNGAEYNFYRVYAFHRNGGKIIPGEAGNYVYSSIALNPVETVTAEASGTMEITVKWSKAKGAEGYYVLRLNDSNQEPMVIGQVQGGNTLKYVDKAPVAGENNYYAIVPYFVDGKGQTIIVNPITLGVARPIEFSVDKINITGYESYTEAYKVLDIVNQERAAAGLPALTMDADLMEAAMQRAAELDTLFSHTRPSGLDCFSVSNKAYGENIAAGGWPYYDSALIMQSWMNSPGHRANILGDYASIGIGCFRYKGVAYWVQLFGYDDIRPATKLQDRNTTRTILVASSYREVMNETDEFEMPEGVTCEKEDYSEKLNIMKSFTQENEF